MNKLVWPVMGLLVAAAVLMLRAQVPTQGPVIAPVPIRDADVSAPQFFPVTGYLWLPQRFENVPLVRQGDGRYVMSNYRIAGVNMLKIYRNGLRQAPKVDYTLDANANQVVPNGTWAINDMVFADFEVTTMEYRPNP
jgi:hypothetical protein